MSPDYSTFQTYHRLTNRCATLGDTTKLPLEEYATQSRHSIVTPYSLKRLYTLLHYKDHYTQSASTFSAQGVVSTTHIRLDHTSSYQTSSYKWKTHLTTQSAIGLLAHNIKVPSTTQNLKLQVPRLWQNHQAYHLQLLLNQKTNHQMMSQYNPKILYYHYLTATINLNL